jgi:hypothetical protein
MSRSSTRPLHGETRPAAVAQPAWRLRGPVPPRGQPGAAWKWLLAVAVLVQAAWILALLAMAIR